MSCFPHIQHYIDDWLRYLSAERRYSHHTIDNYRRDLFQFLHFMTDHKGESISIDLLLALELTHLRSWLVQRSKKEYSVRATARAVSSVRNFFRFLAKYHGYLNTTIENLRTPSIPESLPKALSVEDSKRTVSSIGNHHPVEWINLRDVALLLLLYGCGLRISEALSLTLQQVKNQTSLHITGKGNKDRIVPLLPAVTKAITDYLNQCPYDISPKDFIFRGARGKPLRPEIFQKTLRTLRKQYGLPSHTTPHAFRHSFATHLLQNHPDGMDPLRLIQQLLGHESLATTQRYTKVESSYLLDTYQKAHPLSDS